MFDYSVQYPPNTMQNQTRISATVGRRSDQGLWKARYDEGPELLEGVRVVCMGRLYDEIGVYRGFSELQEKELTWHILACVGAVAGRRAAFVLSM